MTFKITPSNLINLQNIDEIAITYAIQAAIFHELYLSAIKFWKLGGLMITRRRLASEMLPFELSYSRLQYGFK